MSEITLLRKEMELGSYKILRRRYIPLEEVDISSDKLIYKDDNLIITAWKPIKEREDMGQGMSYWFLNKGYKISKIYDKDGKLIHYYCDIARFEINEEDMIIKVIDLLADVIIKEDNTYKVVDIDELLDAYDQKLITQGEFIKSLTSLSNLLNSINSNEFPFEELYKY